MNVARVAALRAGLPVTVAATTVNRFCSSGLQAIAMAAHEIINEGADAAIGGGVESITMPAQRRAEPGDERAQARHLHGDGRHGRSRGQALQRQPPSRRTSTRSSSQQRTARAQQEGFFEDELAPMKVTRGILDKKTGRGRRQGRTLAIAKDECNRPDTTLEGLLALKPYFDQDQRRGIGHGRQRLATVRRRVGRPC